VIVLHLLRSAVAIAAKTICPSQRRARRVARMCGSISRDVSDAGLWPSGGKLRTLRQQ